MKQTTISVLASFSMLTTVAAAHATPAKVKVKVVELCIFGSNSLLFPVQCSQVTVNGRRQLTFSLTDPRNNKKLSLEVTLARDQSTLNLEGTQVCLQDDCKYGHQPGQSVFFKKFEVSIDRYLELTPAQVEKISNPGPVTPQGQQGQ